MLVALHAGGIIHGNLEPSNFLYVGGKLCLIDFGSSSLLTKGGAKSTLVKHDSINLDYASCETVNEYTVIAINNPNSGAFDFLF